MTMYPMKRFSTGFCNLRLQYTGADEITCRQYVETHPHIHTHTKIFIYLNICFGGFDTNVWVALHTIGCV